MNEPLNASQMDPTLQAITLGFLVASTCLFVWASIDFNRFQKFLLLRDSSPKSLRLLVHAFFVTCVLGGLEEIREKLTFATHVTNYRTALLSLCAWLAVIFALVHFVEWMNSRLQRSRSQK